MVDDQPTVSNHACKPVIKMVSEDLSQVGVPSEVLDIELRRMFNKRTKHPKGLLEPKKPRKPNDTITPFI